MTYKTSLDNAAKAITAGITLLFAVIIIMQVSLIKDVGYAIPIITTVSLLLIFFGTFSLRPVSYKLTDDRLIIHRPLHDVKIDRNKINSVELLDKDKLAWSIRTFGDGGLFGYFGRFANRKIGSMIWYATRRNNQILIKTNDNKKIILTPDKPERFVAEFNINS